MAASIEDFTKAEFAKQLKRLEQGLPMGCTPSLKPAAVLLGGQSGAGKTRLLRIVMEQHGYNFIVINGDEYRSSHPRFIQIQRHYGIDAPAHTAAWSGKMTEALIDAFSLQGYNLIIEGALRTSDVPLATARLLRQRGYDVSLAVMAVKPDISLVSCQIRYELMRAAGTTPRAVDPAHHQRIVRDICDNLATLEASGLFSQVSLYNRAAECLFAAHCSDDLRGPADLPATAEPAMASAPTAATQDAPASAALRDILFGEWTTQERDHYDSLCARLTDVRSQSGPESA